MGRGALLPMQRNDETKVTLSANMRWEAFHGDNKDVLYYLHGGKMGLFNMGNTCFMNAGLQCLAHVEPVAAYFLTGKYKEEINATNPLGCKGKLAFAFAQLLKDMWRPSDRSSSSSKPLLPKQMHRALERFAPHLIETREQQDIQEFLAYMLDGLSEDLNLVKEKPPPDNMGEEEEEKMYIDLEKEHGEEVVAALHWKKYLTRNKSFLVDICQGQLRSVLTCTECGNSSKTFDPYLYLSLPVSASMNSVSDALQKFLEKEQLEGDNMWRCNRCKKKVVASKKMDIYKAPSVLILHLKRFSFNDATCTTTKVSTFLDTPLTVDLSDHIVSHHKDSLTYDIIGVAKHSGAHGSGHYTATCRHHIDNEYYHFDDDGVVCKVEDLDEIITAEAYVLFLLRHAEQTDHLRRQTITLPDVWPHWVSQKDLPIVPIRERAAAGSDCEEDEDKTSGQPSDIPHSLVPHVCNGGSKTESKFARTFFRKMRNGDRSKSSFFLRGHASQPTLHESSNKKQKPKKSKTEDITEEMLDGAVQPEISCAESAPLLTSWRKKRWLSRSRKEGNRNGDTEASVALELTAPIVAEEVDDDNAERDNSADKSAKTCDAGKCEKTCDAGKCEKTCDAGKLEMDSVTHQSEKNSASHQSEKNSAAGKLEKDSASHQSDKNSAAGKLEKDSASHQSEMDSCGQGAADTLTGLVSPSPSSAAACDQHLTLPVSKAPMGMTPLSVGAGPRSG